MNFAFPNVRKDVLHKLSMNKERKREIEHAEIDMTKSNIQKKIYNRV